MKKRIVAMAIAASVSMLLMITTAEDMASACTIDGEPCNGDPEPTADDAIMELASQLNFPRIEAHFERLMAEKLSNAILMTDQDCSIFGERWKPYGPMSGRFPIAAGSGTDDRGESRIFKAHDRGGEYQHVLTKSEMPKHQHDYKDLSYGTPPERVDHGDDRAQERSERQRVTGSTGKDQPHNNMPPYLVLNFCSYHKP